ncbi:SDR family NAD(P)-dependent oxidoreductase [Sphingomicrobium lutaoense]|uniref:SDR family NAD(P)-dependent oxidoreductase n=1 Tax=Sphingomicrobium lutaoense TaxID=515949 RepID=UPI0022407A94|nr:SDR family oxidoreductase [Sphingomicrobium lutaoense]
MLENRHALITGGGSGIGASTAAHLAAAGAKCSLLGRRSGPIEQVAGETSGKAIPCDVTDRKAIEAAYESARHAHGPIELLIVNAGIADSAPFAKLAADDWDRIIAVNLTAAFHCAQAALPDLLEGKDTRIIFVASVAGLRGTPYAAHYAASKHGLLGLMRSMAKEFAKSPLTVNAICPGYVDTPMTDQSASRVAAKTGRSEAESREAIAAFNANGRLVHPDGVATQIFTLCLPQSRDVNGAALVIDGGSDA